MKSKRHNRILEIINKKEIETQEELAEEWFWSYSSYYFKRYKNIKAFKGTKHIR